MRSEIIPSRLVEAMMISDDLVKVLKTHPLSEITEQCWYGGYMAGIPDLLVLRMPPALYSSPVTDEPVCRVNHIYRVAFVEQDRDRRWLERALSRPIDLVGRRGVSFNGGFDRVNTWPSTLPPLEHVVGVLLYVPTEPHWPYFSVSMSGSNDTGASLARHRYAWEAFPDERSALDFMGQISGMVTRADIEVELFSPEGNRRDA